MQRTNLKTWVVMSLFLLGMVSTATGEVIYVDANAPLGGNGTSWETAYKYLQDALAAASSGDEILVAQGAYKPDQGGGNTGGNREATFQLKNGVGLYGGFPPGGGQWDNRDPNAYEIVLSGDLAENDIMAADIREVLYEPSRADNSYHVIISDTTDGTTVLDGFTIRGGNAHGEFHWSDPRLRGGGMYNVSASPVLINCTFVNNAAEKGGGGVYNYSSNPTVINCSFTRNSGNGIWSDGGGMYNERSNPKLTNCTFQGNVGLGYGGGVSNEFSDPVLINCVFRGNSAYSSGGGMYNYSGSSTLINCTFSGNSAAQGGGMYNYSGSSTVTNCILWGDTAARGPELLLKDSALTISYSDVQGGQARVYFTSGSTLDWIVGNIEDDPLFVRHPSPGPDGRWDGVDDDFGDLRLRCGSPCLDTGTNTTDPTLPPTDLDGNQRIVATIADIGAYEGPNQGFVISGRSVLIHEGSTTTFSVALACDPCGSTNVTIANYNGDPDINVVSGALSFDPMNFWIPQVVVLEAAEDADRREGVATIRVSGSGVSFGRVTAWEFENDVGSVIFVDTSSSGTNDGSSWADAFNKLSDAMILSAGAPQAIDEVWVAEGTYTPDGATLADLREATFKLVNDVAIYGGFVSGGGPFQDRNPNEYETVLSGDLNKNDVDVDDPRDLIGDPCRAENCYNVVTGSETDETAILDGFTITGGYADGPSWEKGYKAYPFGGGVYNYAGRFTLTNCCLIHNVAVVDGGAMYNHQGSRPTVANCTFSRNAVRNYGGGGMYNDNSSPIVTDCTFVGNSAVHDGGGMHNRYDSSPWVVNCTFSGNSTGRYGGGMFNLRWSNPRVLNCTFQGNSAGNRGGGMYNYWDSSPTLTNCILWGDSAPTGPEIYNDWASSPTVSYSDVEGGWPGEGNINADPLFVSGPLDDFYLSQVAAGQLVDSPCVDAGSGDANDPNIGMDQYTTRTDHVGDAGIVDMGYHYVPTNTPPVANAGPDQTVYTGIGGIAEVTLDGTGSYDDDGDPLTYLWSWTIDDEIITTITTTGSDGIVNMLDFVVLLKQWLRTGNSLADIAPLGGDGLVDIRDLSILTQAWLTTPASPNWNPQCDIAPTGATPIIELPCGVYSIELIVNDGIVDSEPDYVEITVLDGTPPVITCQDDVMLECSADTSPDNTGSATATDNCDDSMAIVYSDSISGTCPMVIERTWTATDASGNSSSCVQLITVQDTTPPVITCLPDLTLECPANTTPSVTGQATATDACGSVTITHSDVSVPGCGNTETITRTWTATDECGNSSSCVQTITVVDTTPPEVGVTVPLAGAAVQDGVTLTAEASDISGVAEVYFYLREPGGTNGIPIGYEDLPGTLNAASGKWEYGFDTTQLLDGYYVILAKAIDTCGNEGWSVVVPFSIRNWAVLELLPASVSNKAGRTMPVKFALRIVESVDPAMPFVYNEELEIRIYDAADQTNILQTSLYGDTSRDYRIDSAGELYITNFKTKRQPAEYVVEIWRISKNFLVGSFTFETVK